MRFPEIEVFLIGKSVPDRAEIARWVQSLPGGEGYEVPEGRTDGETLVESAGRRCYMSFTLGMNPNVTKIREGIADYIANLLKSQHGSVCEHVTYSFAIEGVTRVLTAELNRHRAGVAISEGSGRFIRFSDLPFWMPLSLRENKSDSWELGEKKRRSGELIRRLLRGVEDAYNEFVGIWGLDDPTLPFEQKKKLTSMIRRIVPMGTCTGGVWSFNLRALRHVLTMRCSPAAEEEICFLGGLLLKKMREAEPNIFGDFELVNGYWAPKYVKV